MTMRTLILLTTVATGLLRGNSVTYTVTPMAGQFQYQFTLVNSGDTGGTLWDLFLALPTEIATIDTTTIGTPSGWGDATGGSLFYGPDISPSSSFVQWAADFSGLNDVGNGSSLSGFSFTSTQAIGQPITFALNGSTDFGTAQEVSSVPEPSSFASLTTALLILGGFVARRNFRQQQAMNRITMGSTLNELKNADTRIR